MDTLVRTAKERFWTPEAHTRDQWVKRHAGLIPAGSYVLDAGAGASKYRPFFSHCTYKTQDFCAYTGPLVKYREPIDFVCEITSIPLPDASVDVILSTEVWEHLPDPMAALRECARLLRSGGKLLVTTPLLSTIHMEPYHFYSGLTEFWYRHWLPGEGFKIDEISMVGGPGRTCVVFAQEFYTAWSEAERPLPPVLKAASRFARAVARIPAHVILPRLLPKMDRWLDSKRVGSGLMVAATRK
jgi:SAM-dependent methyltransferase